MSGKKSRDKGARGERMFCQEVKDRGLNSYRIPLSGAMRNFDNDVIIETDFSPLEGEVKLRANGFSQLYKFLQPTKTAGKPPDFLAVKQDRQDFLVVITLDNYVKLLKGEQHEQDEKE